MSTPLPPRDNPDDSEGAQLITFPTQPPAQTPQSQGPALHPELAVESAREVLDRELITEDEYQRRTRLRRVAAVVVRESTRAKSATAAAAPRIAPPVRLVVRAGYTVGAGYLSWARRGAGALTHAHIREQVRMARQTGDRTALAEWSERLVAVKDKRAKRLQQLPKTLLGAAHGLAWGLGLLAALLVLVGVWVAASPGGMGWGDWWLGDIANGIATVVSIAMWLAAWGALPHWCSLHGWKAAGWRPHRIGWRRPATPTWTSPSTKRPSPTPWRLYASRRSPPT